MGEVLEFIHNNLAYQQALVYHIDASGKEHHVTDPSQLYSLSLKQSTIKVEGMERFSKNIWDVAQHFARCYYHTGPVTAHVFIAPVQGFSFPIHTDPDDVIILCCEGTKTMIVDGDEVIIHPGEWIYIPRNVPHAATNETASTTLSIGLEQFFVDKMTMCVV